MSAPESKLSQWTAVASAEASATRAIVPARVGGHDLIVVRGKDGLWACQRWCPHEYADLLYGRVREGQLFCGRHYASFDLADGKSGNGWTLPCLKLYPARIAEGQVEVDAAAVAADPPVTTQRLSPAKSSGPGATTPEPDGSS
jgi:3-phenylpropionate/trans-cinnamate dioxygenase ferredoxin subunit